MPAYAQRLIWIRWLGSIRRSRLLVHRECWLLLGVNRVHLKQSSHLTIHSRLNVAQLKVKCRRWYSNLAKESLRICEEGGGPKEREMMRDNCNSSLQPLPITHRFSPNARIDFCSNWGWSAPLCNRFQACQAYFLLVEASKNVTFSLSVGRFSEVSFHQFDLDFHLFCPFKSTPYICFFC